MHDEHGPCIGETPGRVLAKRVLDGAFEERPIDGLVGVGDRPLGRGMGNVG